MIKCLHFRRIISRSADEDAPLPPAARDHIAQCPDCRRVFQTEREIVRRLALGAPAQKQQQPAPFLHARIMARIASAPPASRRVAQFSRLLRPAAVAAVCLLLTIVLLHPGPKPPSGERARIQAQLPAATAASLNPPDTTPLADWAASPANPLETEMRAIIHDARGATTALADNFFPDLRRGWAQMR
jgi:hypothetical protein